MAQVFNFQLFQEFLHTAEASFVRAEIVTFIFVDQSDKSLATGEKIIFTTKPANPTITELNDNDPDKIVIMFTGVTDADYYEVILTGKVQ